MTEEDQKDYDMYQIEFMFDNYIKNKKLTSEQEDYLLNIYYKIKQDLQKRGVNL